jgi:hypothetical protein
MEERSASASLKAGQQVIFVSLDAIRQPLASEAVSGERFFRV